MLGGFASHGCMVLIFFLSTLLGHGGCTTTTTTLVVEDGWGNVGKQQTRAWTARKGHGSQELDSSRRKMVSSSSSSSFSAIYVMGDSLVDSGNDELLVSSSAIGAVRLPYGRDLPDHRPSGRFSNGLLVSDLIASLVDLPYPPAYLANKSNVLKGTSFGSAGAVIYNKTGYYPLPRLNLEDQVRLFGEVRRDVSEKVGEEAASFLLSKSLFILCFGSNDYVTNYFGKPFGRSAAQIMFSPEAFINTLLTIYRKNLVNLYNLGARKIAVISVPPVGCMPIERLLFKGTDSSCVTRINQEAQNFNAKLLDLIIQLQDAYQDAHFVYLNSFDISLDAITNPSKYGFLYGSKPCCSTGPYGGVPLCNQVISTICDDASQYVFWDFAHPTQTMNSLVINRFWRGTAPDVYPMNLQQLSMV